MRMLTRLADALVATVIFGLFTAIPAMASDVGDRLEKGFQSPPASARPHTWWHWMNGNVTKEGITADLESMKKAGIGGFQMFNVAEWIPDGPAPFMSEKWFEMVQFAAQEADRLGLEMCFHNCAGWSSSGGPWIKPAEGMQTVVTTETQAKGPSKFEAVLPQPTTNHGYYRDIAVLAFPTPKEKATIDRLAPKSLSQQEYEYGLQPDMKAVAAAATVAKDSVVVLTDKLGKDGKLTWDVPAGDWTILRVGHTPTGAVCAPAPVAGRGLECDKLSREAIEAHWTRGVEPILKRVGPLVGKSLVNCLIDSYEVGDNNWTPKFREEFMKRRGYDPIPFLPVLVGKYVGSGELSERFLWDFRRTIADLFSENYFNRFADLCHERGMKFSVEPYDGPFECMRAAAKADVVMGEFWATTDVAHSGAIHTVKLAATAANTHGIPIVGAESFTGAPGPYSNWLGHPGMLKPLGDAIWCLGVNRYIFHTYVHQPWLDQYPGMTMGQWGTHFGRTNTWWEQSRPWMQYIARAQYLLQQGRTVADVLFFAGETAPNGSVYRPDLKAKGYEYDVVGTDLIMKLSVKDGRIMTPAGGSYRVLVLPETQWMTPALVKKVAELATAGAVILGPKPTKSPSLASYPECDVNVKAIADELWPTSAGERAVGKGKVITGRSIEEVLAAEKATPDFNPVGAKFDYIHRAVDDADIYFVANTTKKRQTGVCEFRVDGRQPELWDAESGTVEPAPMWDGNTVTLTLEPASSVFVVFRKPSTEPRRSEYNKVELRNDATSPKSRELEIRKAVYGDLDREDGGRVDVTQKLAARVKDGQLEVIADNDLAGDPAYTIVKKLRVDYAIDGVAKTITVAERDVLQLPPEETIVLPPAPRLTVENEQSFLTVAQPGEYMLDSTSKSASYVAAVPDFPKPAELTGSWDVSFQKGRGAPESAVFEKLISWPESKDKGVKYFSGTATYRKKIEIPAERFGKNRSILLDLGKVDVIAEVRLNGQDLGIVWRAPFRVDITKAAKPGENELEVRVTNLWPNRLIGDEQYPDDCQWEGIHLKQWPDWFVKHEPRPTKERLTFFTWKHWHKDSPLQPSGLIGPVMLLTLEKVPVK